MSLFVADDGSALTKGTKENYLSDLTGNLPEKT